MGVAGCSGEVAPPYQAAMAAAVDSSFPFPRLVVVLFPPPSLTLSLSLSAVCESKILKIDFDFRFVPNKSRGETSDSPKSGKLY